MKPIKKKGRIGKDGKTKQQRYVDRHRAKVNASNNQRNKETRKQRKLRKEEPHKPATVSAPAPNKEQRGSSDDSNFDIALALSLPRSDGPLPPSDPPSPINLSDDDLDAFELLSSRFVMWSNKVDEIMASFGLYWNAREGWKPHQPFTLTRYESQFYLYGLHAKSILSSARRLLPSLTPGEVRWEETLDMIEYLSAHDTFMASIRASWKETTDLE